MKYNYTIERKITAWEQEVKTINAESEDEAIEKLKKLKEKAGEVEGGNIFMLNGTIELLTPKENENCSTFGIKFNGDIIYENGDIGTL